MTGPSAVLERQLEHLEDAYSIDVTDADIHAWTEALDGCDDHLIAHAINGWIVTYTMPPRPNDIARIIAAGATPRPARTRE